MIPNLYLYFEPDTYNAGGYRHYFCKDKLKTYPEALRFTSHSDIHIYYKARQDFIQSTKIPNDSCDNCPLSEYICDLEIPYGGNRCHLTWRKIWEYVK